MKTKKEILKENGLTNIDDFMDVQFGKPGTPERERFREEARIYVNGYAQTAECLFRRAREHYLRNVKFFYDADGKRWLFEKSTLSSLMYLIEY